MPPDLQSRHAPGEPRYAPGPSTAEDSTTDQSPADQLIDLPTRELVDLLATSAPVPGGGSASALAGAMAAALVSMVVELTRGRDGAGDHAAELAAIGDEAARLRGELMALTDRDAVAYQAVIAARRLPRDTRDERSARAHRIVETTREATSAPLGIGRAAEAVIELAGRIAPIGNPTAISDVGVAALLATAALQGAALNVRINLPFLPPDDPLVAEAARAIDELTEDLDGRATAIRRQVEDRMG